MSGAPVKAGIPMTESHKTAGRTHLPRGRTPTVAVISVIEVRFLRGAGIAPDDPIREVVAYFRAETGEQIVEIDMHMKDT